MGRGDGEDWLKGGALQVTGGPPEAAEKRRDPFDLLIGVGSPLLAAALFPVMPIPRAGLTALTIILVIVVLEWLIAPAIGRSRRMGVVRLLAVALMAGLGLAGAFWLDGPARTAVVALGGVVFAGVVLGDWLAGRRRSGAGAPAGAPQ